VSGVFCGRTPDAFNLVLDVAREISVERYSVCELFMGTPETVARGLRWQDVVSKRN
jgi:hypothetical protein